MVLMLKRFFVVSSLYLFNVIFILAYLDGDEVNRKVKNERRKDNEDKLRKKTVRIRKSIMMLCGANGKWGRKSSCHHETHLENC